jgi:hypothetical protein
VGMRCGSVETGGREMERGMELEMEKGNNGNFS